MTRTHAVPMGREGGFTILELTVVLGLLGGFLVFLLQILSTGVELFDEGQSGQELADLAHAAVDPSREAVASMVGPRRQDFEPADPSARLLAQWVPLGFRGEDASAEVQALRATVQLSPQREDELLAERLEVEAAAIAENQSEVPEELARLMAEAVRPGRAEMLLLAWPSADAVDGDFVDLRRGLWLPGEEIELDRRNAVPLFDLARVDTLPADTLLASTEVIASGLLHVEFAFWSQYTTAFRAVGDGAPECVWDSARAGLMAEDDNPRRVFSLDLFEDSLRDTTDDVYPRAVEVTLVVARRGAEGQLAEPLTSGAKRAALLTLTPLGNLDPEGGFVKIGGEWVEYRRTEGSDGLSGLVRGARDTKARTHPVGTPVRAGKLIRFVVPLSHGRDNWNG